MDEKKGKALSKLQNAAALMLWDSGAIKVNAKDPFKLVSGNFSPLYVNCRQMISNLGFMALFKTVARELYKEKNINVDTVAGGETAGIPFAAYLATELGLPMIYVRKGAKSHGLPNLVEGGAVSGSRVLLVEDLITNGQSKMGFIEGLRAAGGTVEHCLVTFDRLQGGRDFLVDEGVDLHSVTDLEIALQAAKQYEIISASDFNLVSDYLKSPKDWHEKMNFEYLEDR